MQNEITFDLSKKWLYYNLVFGGFFIILSWGLFIGALLQNAFYPPTDLLFGIGRQFIGYIIGSSLVFIFSGIILGKNIRLFRKYKQAFLRINDEGVEIMGEKIRWANINSIGYKGVMRIYIANPGEIDTYKLNNLTNQWWSRTDQSRRSTGDVFLPGILFDVPIETVQSALESYRRHVPDTHAEHVETVQKGLTHRKNKWQAVFAIFILLYIFFGVFIYLRGVFSTSFAVTYFLILGILVYFAITVSRAGKN